MNQPPAPGEILRDIEFEILQGVLGQDDLGQGVQAARRFHNRSRHELLEGDTRVVARELAARQAQINDMLLVLIQELASRLRTLQVELQKTAGLAPGLRPDVPPPEVEPMPGWRGDVAAGSASPQRSEPARSALEAAGGYKRLQVEAHLKPVRLPLVGRLLTRLRAALHSLPLYYVQQLGEQQCEINRALGESIDQLSRLVAEQQAQIQALRQQLKAPEPKTDLDRPQDPG